MCGNYLLRLSCYTKCMVLISGLRVLFKSAGGRSSGQYGAKEGDWLPSPPERLKSPPACTSKSLLINMLYLVCLISGRNTSAKCQVAVLSGSLVPDSPGQELPVVFPPLALKALQWGKSHAANLVRFTSRGPTGTLARPFVLLRQTKTHLCVEEEPFVISWKSLPVWFVSSDRSSLEQNKRVRVTQHTLQRPFFFDNKA